MTSVSMPPTSLRPIGFAALAHIGFAAVLFLAHLYQQSIPDERALAPLEVIVMGNLDIEEMKQNARLRTSVQDLREGVVISQSSPKSPSGDLPAAVAPSTGKLGGLLSMTEQLGKQAKPKPIVNDSGDTRLSREQQRMALAVVQKSLREDLIQAGKGSSTDSGLRVVNRIPEKIKGIEWRQIKSPSIQAPTNLSAEELEKLRVTFSTKWVDVRDCYERALQKDEKLNGYVNLQVLVGKPGKSNQTIIDFKGEGDPNSQRSLKSCLTQMTDGMKFFDKLSGQTVQVGYRLTS